MNYNFCNNSKTIYTGEPYKTFVHYGQCVGSLIQIPIKRDNLQSKVIPDLIRLMKVKKAISELVEPIQNS